MLEASLLCKELSLPTVGKIYDSQIFESSVHPVDLPALVKQHNDHCT